MNVTLKKLRSSDASFLAELNSLLNRDETLESNVEGIVANVISDVAENGDQALFRYTQKFDHFDVEARGIEVRPTRLTQALEKIHPEQREALEYAVERVRCYHEKQLAES